MTSSICCCSLKVKDTGMLARFYSTHGYQDGRRSRDTLIKESLRVMESTEKETLRQRLNSFTRQARKSSSMQRFEPCYRQIYPSKKRKATFKIPKKPPHIPVVYQDKTASYRNKYQEMVSQPVKGRQLQWPPLYPSKKRDQEQNKQTEKSNELPPWLLPLYSCKSCKHKETSLPPEARYSGVALHRKMEVMEGLKRIRERQPTLFQKQAKNDETSRLDAKSADNAVEALKQKIDSMQSYLIAVKRLESSRKRYDKSRDDELPEEQVSLRQAYSRIYQTKPPNLTREFRVRKSMGVGTVGPKTLEKPTAGTSNPLKQQATENHKESDINTMHLHKKHEEGSDKNEGEAVNLKQINKQTQSDRTNNLSLGQFHEESVVMIKQPSWKTQQPLKGQMTTDKAIQMKASTKPVEDSVKDAAPKQPSTNVKTQDTNSKEAVKTDGTAWTVESLKTRINVMKVNNTIEESRNKTEDMSGTRNGGESKPKISQVALRSFHREVGSKYPIGQPKEATKPHLGYHRTVGRRNFSTFRHPERVPRHKRTFCTTQVNTKKITWLNRLKKCFALERVTTPKTQNWKEAPREISYEKKEDEFKSPAPVLWKPIVEAQLGKHRSKYKRERVNPAILHAEHRILSGISKLMSAKSQPNIPGVRAIDIEKKISRAKHKVDMMPWLKESKSCENWRRLLQLKGCDVQREQDEPPGTGYEWILKNKEVVEDLKRQSRNAAGKSLVPIEVKNSINEYKLPLKAEISQYRKKIDQKYSDVYACSAPKRFYSTCYSGKHRMILPSTEVFQVKKRGIKTIVYRKEGTNFGKFIERKTRSDIELGINLRRYNQGVNLGRKEALQDMEEETRPKKWAWKVPSKTKAFTPLREARPTPLTSPNKSPTTRMSEMSSCALKKQVEELKRLIKKAREEIAEKTEEPMTGSQTDHETRLKRLIKAAHNNAQKMQIVEPRYTSENNMMGNRPSEKRANPQPMVQYEKPKSNSNDFHFQKQCKPEVSVLESLFKKNGGEPKTLADEILLRNNLTSLPGKKPEKTISSRVYIKLKSLVEAVKRKSAMMDAISNSKLTPNLTGNMSAVVPIQGQKDVESKDNNKPVTVELLADRAPSPTKTIQLWKGETKPTEFGLTKDPSYSDLMNLFSKAKEIFYCQPPQLDNSNTLMLSDDKQTAKASHREISENWLSIREDVSKAAKAVSVLKDYPSGAQQNFFFFNSQSKNDASPLTEFMMAKSKMLPMEVLKSDADKSCGMWSNVPINIHENEDLCGKSSEVDQQANQIGGPSAGEEPEAKPSTSNEYETSFIQEPRKFLFHKPLITWESISQNFSNSLGRNLFGKPADSERAETITDSGQDENQNQKIEDVSDKVKPSHSEIKEIQDNLQNQRPRNLSAESSNPDFAKAGSMQNPPSMMREANLSSIDQTCAPNLGPLEEKVKKYETFYRRHFTEDLISGFENLHQVYGDLDKVNDWNQDHDDDNQSKRAGKGEGHVNDSVSETVQKAMVDVGNTVNENSDAESHGMIQSTERCLTKAMDIPGTSHAIPETKAGLSTAANESTNVAVQPTPEVSGQGFNEATQMIKGDRERFDESGVEGDALLKPVLTESVQRHTESDDSGDQEKENFDTLLSQDPTLNPEVVKRLKLPVIISDDGHTEKNWYTKFQSGPRQNH